MGTPLRHGSYKHRRQKIAGATGGDVKFRAERKLGGSAEALAPHGSRADLRALITQTQTHGASEQCPPVGQPRQHSAGAAGRLTVSRGRSHEREVFDRADGRDQGEQN